MCMVRVLGGGRSDGDEAAEQNVICRHLPSLGDCPLDPCVLLGLIGTMPLGSNCPCILACGNNNKPLEVEGKPGLEARHPRMGCRHSKHSK